MEFQADGASLQDLCDFINKETSYSVATDAPAFPINDGYWMGKPLDLIDQVSRVNGFFVIESANMLFIKTSDDEEKEDKNFSIPARVYVIETSSALDIRQELKFEGDALEKIKFGVPLDTLSASLGGARVLQKVDVQLRADSYTFEGVSEIEREQRAVTDQGTSTVTGYSQTSAGLIINLQARRLTPSILEVQYEIEDSSFTKGTEKSTIRIQGKNLVERRQNNLLTEYNKDEKSLFLGLANSGKSGKNTRSVILTIF